MALIEFISKCLARTMVRGGSPRDALEGAAKARLEPLEPRLLMTVTVPTAIESFSLDRFDSLQRAEVETFTGTAVFGCYRDNWLAAVSGARLFKIRARSVVVATGAYENPLLFDDNDLPGVTLGGGVQRLSRQQA